MQAEGKQRLLVVASTYPRWAGDGEPGFVHELCKRLTKWFDVRVLTSHAAGAALTESMDAVEVFRFRYAPAALESLVHGGGIAANVKEHRWKVLLLPTYMVGMAYAVSKSQRTWRSAVTHAHWFVPSGVAAAMVAGTARPTPLVVTAHGSDVHALRGGLWRGLRRWVAARTARITAVGHPLARQIEEECGRSVDIIPMGVDMDTLFVPPIEPTASDTVLYVGRLVAQKRPQDAILAFHQALPLRPDLRLVIIGDGPLRQELAALAGSLGLGDRVTFAGRLPHGELARWYQAALATLIPSGGADAPEGLGLAAVEALACGCAVVSVPNPALQAVLPRQAPVHFSPDVGPASLGRTLCEFVAAAGARDATTAAWRPQLVAEFGWPAVAARHAAVLKAAANRT